ncbi:MAG TPA: alpha/beta fold hydrolase [Steroidobacteraceae bacterium]|nr:alpha/beta fold hydrolase [Steroidobacteraceae bacterium]
MAKGSVTNRTAEIQPRVRRGYFECRYGQLHVHNAIPPGGGFDEATSVICLHQFPQSGRVFLPLLARLGRDRSVYAPDLPGYGASDAPATRPALADYAAAIADFCDSMRFRQIDVIGFHDGSLVAVELALMRPTAVRRVVCIGVPVAGEAEREQFRRSPWPAAPAADGGFLQTEWRRLMSAEGPGRSLEVAAGNLADALHAGPQASWGVSAALQYPLRERLSQLTHSTLFVRPRDALWESTIKARELMPKARVTDLPEVGADAVQTAPDAVVRSLQEFLRS